MFVFEDLASVDDAGIREIIQRADKKVLTIALKGTTEEIRERFFENMSKRAADLIKEEMEVLGAIRLREVEKAQQEVVAIARKLEEEGLLDDGRGGGRAICHLEPRESIPRRPSRCLVRVDAACRSGCPPMATPEPAASAQRQPPDPVEQRGASGGARA